MSSSARWRNWRAEKQSRTSQVQSHVAGRRSYDYKERMDNDPKTIPPEPETRDPQMAKLAAMGVKVRPKYAWMKTFGRYKEDDPYHESAVRLGAEWRAEENRRSIEELDAGS